MAEPDREKNSFLVTTTANTSINNLLKKKKKKLKTNFDYQLVQHSKQQFYHFKFKFKKRVKMCQKVSLFRAVYLESTL